MSPFGHLDPRRGANPADPPRPGDLRLTRPGGPNGNRNRTVLALGVVALLVGTIFLIWLPSAPGPHADPSRAGLDSLHAAYVNDGVSPPPTANAGSTFDGADGYVLMFGGTSSASTPEAQTWSFAHTNWTNLVGTAGLAPSARWGDGLTYDIADGYAVLFGGCLNSGCTSVSNDTWTFVAGHWTDETSRVGISPSDRGRTMMTYDALDGYVLLFGGIGSNGGLLNDTWVFKADHWSRLTNASAAPPSARAGASFAYDPPSNSAVLYGGLSSTGHLADTWAFHAGNWTNITRTAGLAPSPRWLAGMTYDGVDGYLLLVNGFINGNFLGDEWAFSGGTWTLLHPANPPLATFGSVLVYDPPDATTLFFSGGASGGYLTSTLLYRDGSWTLLINPPGSGLAPAFFVLFPLVILLVVIPIAVLAGNRLRRRRERALGSGFEVPPGAPVTWLEAGAQLRNLTLLQVIPPVALIAVLIPLLGFQFFVLGFALLAIPLVLVFVALGAIVLYAGWSQVPRAIGIAQGGVIVRRKSGDLRVPWAQLQPSIYPPRRGIFTFQFLWPGQQQPVSGFPTTAAQAKAIVLSPYAPPWVLSPPFASALGDLSQRRVAPTTSASPLVANPMATTPSFGGLPKPPGVPAGRPLASAGTPWSASPFGYAATAPSIANLPPPPPPVPPPPPPGTILCPRCGQLNASRGYAFCRSCGSRLPV